LELNPGVNGTGGFNRTLLFILSRDQGNRFAALDTKGPVETDFVRYKGTRRTQFISCSLGGDESLKDGRFDSFFGYNVIEFGKDGELHLANGLDRRFPMWVLFAFNPNHSETGLLTKALVCS